MSEVLLGVIIGGVLASVTPIISIFIDHIKWKKEQKIEYLKLKRDRLERAFKEASSTIAEGLTTGIYSIEAVTDFDILYPKKVQEAFEKLIKTKENDPENTKQEFYNLTKCMKNELAAIEKQIELLFS